MTNRAGFICLLLLLGARAMAEDPSAEWRFHGRDPGGSRYSPLNQINTENVHRLEPAWVYRTGDIAEPGAHYAECTPLVIDNVMYIITPFSRLIALNATTGEKLWNFDPNPPLDLAENGGGGLASRGVAYWESGSKKRVFLPVRDGRLYSIDIGTRKPDPQFGKGGLINLREGLPRGGAYLFLSSPPMVCENTVIQGFGINDSSDRQPYVPLRAFDAHTGAVKWTFHTIPREGEAGNETWEGDSWKNRGGCNVWSLMGMDAERGIVYLPVGAPNNDKYGGDRHGDNLFANSIVALDAKTGKRLWHYQLVHHDVWDYDMAAAPNVVDLQIDGNAVPAVAIAGKTGFVYVFNRVTGEPVFPIHEKPVPQSDVEGEMTSKTQPFPSKPPAFSRQRLTVDGLHRFSEEEHRRLAERLGRLRSEGLFTPPSERGSIVFPGQLGGANWSGAAADPDGMLYVNANELAYISEMREAPDSPFGYRPRAYHFRDSNGLPAIAPPWGTLTKIDLNRGGIAWQIPLGEHPAIEDESLQPTGTMNFGGATVTGGGLVFIASTMDEKFRAFRAEDGALLFEYRMNSAGYGAPVTYGGEDGRQYVTVFAGGGCKPGTGPGDYVYAFSLPGQ